MLMTDLIHALHDGNASHAQRLPPAGKSTWYTLMLFNNMTHIYNIRIVMGMCHGILQVLGSVYVIDLL